MIRLPPEVVGMLVGVVTAMAYIVATELFQMEAAQHGLTDLAARPALFKEPACGTFDARFKCEEEAELWRAADGLESCASWCNSTFRTGCCRHSSEGICSWSSSALAPCEISEPGEFALAVCGTRGATEHAAGSRRTGARNALTDHGVSTVGSEQAVRSFSSNVSRCFARSLREHCHATATECVNQALV
mmetsp:Transcript_7659/g.24247  ORF Transcript_7659/g.24247 Transcript_7659/m.24247 type:complete len:189 (+) Transcript_7659:38-604(+)